MNLEVVGRHALFFDDDATASFINSSDALVDWNSLLIDRYDVRHLLSTPPPPRKRRNSQQTHSSPLSSIESELDQERYLDLPPPEEEDSDVGATPADGGGYNAVAFSYGNNDESTEQKDSDTGLGDSDFRPPFPMPESLLQSLPPTEKVHQIIARTAIFVSKHGGQSEIVLRVKQGDNPTFGFLMPDHHLHAYYRFLVEHPELLQSDTDGKSEYENKANTESSQPDGVGSGALSLLGSVYGSGEDEYGTVEDAAEHKETVPQKTSDSGGLTVSLDSEKSEFSMSVDGKDVSVVRNPAPPKDKAQVLKRNSLSSAPKAGKVNSLKKDDDTHSLLSSSADKSRSSSLPNLSKVESFILEPPSDIKRLVDKIIEFILRNGKQFEAVLIEQDSKHGKFPFLLPSNQYHPYYVKVLQKAQKSKLAGKSFISEKEDAKVNRLEKKTSMPRENDSLSVGAGCDIPYDSDRKEKFRMVIGKSKKDGQDPPSKAAQSQFGVSVDAASAAAILQAATRGIKNPNFGFLSGGSLIGEGHGRNSEGDQASSLGSHLSSQKVNKSDPIPASKAIAKTAAVEAANEADSSEAHLTKEQKVKAERLKRAKMFVAMLKSGDAPIKSEAMHSLSVEPQVSGVSGDGVNIAGKEREGSSVPVDVDIIDKVDKSEKKNSDDEYHGRRSQRKYRSRSSRPEENEDEDEEVEVEKDYKPSRKKHRSHRSSREEGKEEEGNEERDQMRAKKKSHSHRSSREEDKEEDKVEREHRHARKKHRSYHASHEHGEGDEDERDHRHGRKKHRSYHSSGEEDGEDNEDERDHRHGRKKHWSPHSSCEEDGEDDEDERDYGHARKKRRSYRSSHEEDEEVDEDERDHKHAKRKRHSSYKEDGEDLDERDHKHSKRKHQSYHSSQEEDDEEVHEGKSHKHSRKKHRSHGSSRHSRDRHRHKERHSSSKNVESQDGHRHESCSDDEHHNHGGSKHRKIPRSSEELEEGEISSKNSERSKASVGAGVSREASSDLSKSYKDEMAPSQPSEPLEVSEDLRAKIRAMLMATL